MNAIMNFGAQLMMERPVKNKSMDDIMAMLRESGETIATRIEAAKETDSNQNWVAHIIGIERWSQQRLKCALGEPFVEEEYDAYRPPEDTPWDTLKEHFEATRQQTIDLAGELGQRADLSQKVKHNSFGDLTVRGWLKYIDSHAGMTSRLLR